MAAKEEGVSNKSKRVVLLGLIRDLLPKMDPEKGEPVIKGLTFDLKSLATQSNMVAQELERFLRETNLFVEIKNEADDGTNSKFTFVEGYETLDDVLGTIDIGIKKERNDIVRKHPLSKAAMDAKLGRK